MLSTTEARGCSHALGLSLRVHPACSVSSLTFRMVVLHAPLLLKPSLQARVRARVAAARREAALLAEALWVEEEREARCEENVHARGPEAVPPDVRARAEVAARHRRWRSEARRSGRVVELARAMLEQGMLEHADRFHAILARAADAAQPTAASVGPSAAGRERDIGDIGVVEQRSHGDLLAAAGAELSHRAAKVDTSLDAEALMEEALYPFRRTSASALSDAIASLPPLPDPAERAPATAGASSTSAAVVPLPAPLSPSAPSASSTAPTASPYSAAAGSAEPYVAFTPRAWCDGAFLRSSLSLSSAHVSPHSTVYLLFECPHSAHARAHRELVYAAGAGRHGFAVFVRHTQSRSLLRVIVGHATPVWRVKAVAVRQCYDWDEEGLTLLDEERRRRQGGGQGAGERFDLSAADDDGDDGEARAEFAAPSERCALLHHGRVCFDDDSMAFSGIGPGDVLVLLDKQAPSDASLEPLRYAAPGWYAGRLCAQPVERSTVFDLQAMVVQLRERVDEILHRPQHHRRMQEAFSLLDPHHSGRLNEQELGFTAHTVLRMLQQRLAATGEHSARHWLVTMDGQTGGSAAADSGAALGFDEPAVLPTDCATSFPHFLRLLGDCLVELMRARQFDLLLPGQAFAKPQWWCQDRLNADNHRLLHTVFSTLPQLSAHRDEAVKADGEWTAAHMSTFLGRAGLSAAEHSAAADASSASDAGRSALEDTYILSQVLKAEQERQRVEQCAHHIHRGFTFSARRRHDLALDTFARSLEACVSEDFELDSAEQVPRHLVSYLRTGVLTVLQFLLRPPLLFQELSRKLWQQNDGGREAALRWAWATTLLLLYTAALCGFFYIPFTLVAVYFLYAQQDAASTVSVLECLLPLATTCLLIAYQVNDAVSAQLLQLEDDEQRVGEAYALSKLLCLEMRSSPVLLDYDGREEATKKAERREREKLLRLTKEVGHVLQAASDAGGDGKGVESMFVQAGEARPRSGWRSSGITFR